MIRRIEWNETKAQAKELIKCRVLMQHLCTFRQNKLDLELKVFLCSLQRTGSVSRCSRSKWRADNSLTI